MISWQNYGLVADADYVCDVQWAHVRGGPAYIVLVFLGHGSVTNVFTFRSTIRCRMIGKNKRTRIDSERVERFPRTLRGPSPSKALSHFAKGASHFHGLTMPVEDGLNDFSPSWTKRL